MRHITAQAEMLYCTLDNEEAISKTFPSAQNAIMSKSKI